MRTQVARRCQHCGDEFKVYDSIPKKLCSAECQYEWQKEHRIGWFSKNKDHRFTDPVPRDDEC